MTTIVLLLILSLVGKSQEDSPTSDNPHILYFYFGGTILFVLFFILVLCLKLRSVNQNPDEENLVS